MILGNGGSGEKLDGSETYSDRIGLFFFFTACAGVSIVVWVFNWICWVNQCCCCDFLHNPVNKRIAWWMSFSFLLGILACCISGFISGNRFGYAIEGTWCALDRIYYDIIEGPIVKSDQKWKGLTDEKTIKIDKIADEEPPSYTIKKTDTEKIKTEFIDKIDNLLYGLKVCRVFTMIYFSLFLIAVIFAGISMMFYACLKRQGYLIIFMHVLWNVIRFFIFSFFLFGTAYGIFFLMLRDARGVVRIIFESGENTAILGESNTNLASFFKDFSSEDIIKKKCYIYEGSDQISDTAITLPAEAQYNTTLKDFHREILVRCTMCKPEEVHDLFQQLKQEYLNRGGQAVMDERTAAWDIEHPAQ